MDSFPVGDPAHFFCPSLLPCMLIIFIHLSPLSIVTRIKVVLCQSIYGRRGYLKVGVLDSESGGPGSWSGQPRSQGHLRFQMAEMALGTRLWPGHCVVFLGKTRGQDT